MEKISMTIIKLGFLYFIGRFLITIIFNVQFTFLGVGSVASSVLYLCMDIYRFMDELYYLLETNEISLEDNIDRDKAIRLLLKTKRKKGTEEITDKQIVDVQRKKGMEGIKKYFRRNVCYLYSTIFCFDILFYHYKNDWSNLEKKIKEKLNDQK